MSVSEAEFASLQSQIRRQRRWNIVLVKENNEHNADHRWNEAKK